MVNIECNWKQMVLKAFFISITDCNDKMPFIFIMTLRYEYFMVIYDMSNDYYNVKQNIVSHMSSTSHKCSKL